MEAITPLNVVTAHQAIGLCEAVLSECPVLIVSDFDGTLSHIVMDPWGARIIPGAQRALRQLTCVDGVHIAFLSGRLVHDLAARARIGGATYVGNFGMERGWLARRGRVADLQVDVLPTAASDVAMADRLAAEVPVRVGAAWLVVEHKPASVAFHFRAAPDVDAAAAQVRLAVDGIDSDGRLVRHAGRRVLELRPRGAPSKGDAFRALLADSHPRVAMMLGDDVSDVPAFAALREAREAGTLGGGLAIAVRARDEVPAAVVAAADLILGSPAEAARFLTMLAAAVSAKRG